MVWPQVAVRVCPGATSFATAVSVSHAACATAAGLNAPHAVRLVAQFVVCGVSAHESHAAAAAQHCGRSMPPRKCDMTVRAHGVVVSHPLCMRKALGSIPSVRKMAGPRAAQAQR